MHKLSFYNCDQHYVDEVQLIEPKIPQHCPSKKPLCGVLLRMQDFDYLAPISSLSKQQKTNFVIKNSNGKPVGCVRFSFMFPIPMDHHWIKDFSHEDDAHRFLLLEELGYCNRKAKQIAFPRRNTSTE